MPPTPRGYAPATRTELEQAASLAGRDWKDLWLRMRTISPRSLARTALVVGGLALLIWMVLRAGSALAPFWVGLVVAYITAPLVRSLDRILPRSVAVLVVLLLELLVIALFFVILAPTLVREFNSLMRALPEGGTARERIDQMLVTLRALPEPVQEFVRGWLQNGYTKLQSNFGLYLQQATLWGVNVLLRLLRSVTFLLGFLVIPQWLVAVLNSHDRGKRGVDAVLADWLRPDFWAAVGIVDRTFAVYVRGRAIIALAVSLLTWVGLALLPYLGLPPLPYINAIALITFMLNLIPVIGPFLAAVPPLVLAVAISWEQAAIVLGLIVIVHVIKSVFIQSRVEDRAVDIHAAILAFIIVLASQFGLIWAVLAGPIAVAVRDLFRYVYGRLLVPSRPAGVLPGTSEYVALMTRRVPAPQSAPPVALPASGD